MERRLRSLSRYGKYSHSLSPQNSRVCTCIAFSIYVRFFALPLGFACVGAHLLYKQIHFIPGFVFVEMYIKAIQSATVIDGTQSEAILLMCVSEIGGLKSRKIQEMSLVWVNDMVRRFQMESMYKAENLEEEKTEGEKERERAELPSSNNLYCQYIQRCVANTPSYTLVIPHTIRHEWEKTWNNSGLCRFCPSLSELVQNFENSYKAAH